MRKLTLPLFLPLAFVGTTSLVACHFQMRAGDDPKQPKQQAQPNAPAPSQTVVQHTPNRGPIKHSGRTPSPTPSSSQTTPPAPIPVPAGAAVVSAATIFGGPTIDPNGYKGNIYWIPVGTTKLPNLSAMTPAGFLFASSINVAPQTFSTGFPGVDAAHKENFAIHYEGPLVVATEADYDFKLVADDGAQLRVDATQATAGSTPIVDNDGVKTAAATVTGPIHLIVGTHLVAVDYFQAAGSNVALQFFCTKSGGTEQVCPTKLP